MDNNENKIVNENITDSINFDEPEKPVATAASLEDSEKTVNVLDLSNTNISTSLLNKEKDIKEINTIQINKVVTPIRVDESISHQEPQYKEIPIEGKKSKNLLFVVILLLLIAILMIVIIYLLYPAFNKKEEIIKTVAPNTTTKLVLYDFNSLEISPNMITSSGEFILSENYTLTTTLKNKKIDIEVNGKYVTSNSRLYNNIAFVDDLLIFVVDDISNRTGKIFIVDTNGEVIKCFDKISDDMKMEIGPSSVSFNSGYITILSTRKDGENLFLNNDALNICNKEALKKAGVSDDLSVIGVYKVTYLGNHKFSDPVSLNYVTLSEYLETDNTCD